MSFCEFLGDLLEGARVYTSGDRSVMICGRPIWNDQVSDSFYRQAIQDGSLRPVLESLNGEFLLVLMIPGRICVATDRFGSIPLFHALSSGTLLLSTSYFDLVRRLRSNGSVTLNPQAFYEFFHLQKLLGEKTYDNSSRCLPSGTVLEFDIQERSTRQTSYWRPDFTKSSDSLEELGAKLARSISKSIERKTSDGKRYGLLLSGGMDSRAVLAGFPEGSQPACFTIGDTENNEVRIAGALANAAKAPHHFLSRDPNHYASILSPSTSVGGGMYTFDHGHFFGFGDRVSTVVDTLFHGHGIDYLFQGMYLPTTYTTIFGKRTYIEHLRHIDPAKIAADYPFSVKFRLKDQLSMNIVLPKHRNRIGDWLGESIKDVLAPVENRVQEPYDLWDYLHIHNVSRHYTYLNLLSITEGIEQRSVTFDNDIYSLYFSLPAKTRVGGKILKVAIKSLNPSLLKVPNANTNLSASSSGLGLTLYAAWHAIARRSPLIPSRHSYPSVHDRSWPDRNEVLRTLPALRDRALELSQSEALDSLDLFDMDQIRQMVQAHLATSAPAGATIMSLITIDELIKQAFD